MEKLSGKREVYEWFRILCVLLKDEAAHAYAFTIVMMYYGGLLLRSNILP